MHLLRGKCWKKKRTLISCTGKNCEHIPIMPAANQNAKQYNASREMKQRSIHRSDGMKEKRNDGKNTCSQ